VEKEPGRLEAVAEGARIQTFLIADVRGYTLFTQQRGDEAAAKLAAKFAGIARETVVTRGGRVVELRGDEALAVFPSARQAVAAAVDLQERFVEETIDDAELPMPVGIGLDAGEAVPVEEGYRGGALNLAARLCGQAGPGEILASRGVTHLAGRVEGVRFVDRGRVHLKNLTEPVELVRVVPEGADPADRLRAALPPTPPAHRRPRAKIAIAGVVAIVIAVGATIVLLPDGAEPTIAAGAVGLISLSGDLEGTVDVGEFPRGLARGEGSLWAADQESGSLVEVNPSTFQVEERIPVGVGPTGVAIAAGYVWVTNTDERTVSVVDPEAHHVVDTVVVGNGPAGIVADGDRVWVANSVDATVSEIDATNLKVKGSYPVGERPIALAVGSGAVWVANASDGTVSRVVSGDGQTQTIPVGRGPAAIAFAFGSLWVANAEDGTVTTIDAATGSATTARVGNDPVALAAAGDGMWVASARDSTILRVDPTAKQVTDTYRVGNEPRALAGTEGGLWVGVEASPAAHRGGTLKLVKESPMSIDPDGDDVLNWMVLASTYDGLVTYRKTGGPAGQAIVPDLAVSVPMPSDAGLTYTFTLRDEIRFSNGHVLTPEDVVATFERVLVKNTGWGGSGLPELVGGSTCMPGRPGTCDLSRGVVADEEAGTVTFHLRRRAPDFLLILATPPFAIVPAGTPIRLRAPIPATGPYEITDVGQASRGRDWTGARYGPLVLERNPMFHEWSSDAQPDGFADRIEVMTGVDPHEQVAMVERGEADVGLDGVRADLVEGLERRASDQLMRSQYPAIGALALNTRTYPFDHPDARRAVAYALDRDLLNRAWAETAENQAGGSGSVAERPVVTCQILPPNTPGYAPYCPYTRPAEVVGQWVGPDLSLATSLVDRSGTKGSNVTIGMSPCLDLIATVVSDTLRDLEYQVHREIDGPDFAPTDCQFGAITPDADVSSTAWFNGYPSAAVFLVPLLSCVQPDGTPAVKGVVDYTFNASNFCDPEIDRRMQRAVDLQLTDAHAAARSFESLEHDLIDLAPLIPFQTGYDTWLVSKRASNVEFNMQLLGPIVSQMWVR
jgi:YVTN family beta-propeller protein